MKNIFSLHSNIGKIRAQMKIQQMAFMIIAVVLFLALAGMFILVIKVSDIKESANLLEGENAMLLATKIANSPEFSCGNSFGRNQIKCIDADKVMMLKQNIEKYEDFWGRRTNIEIRIIYPEPEEEIFCELETYPNCNVINLKNERLESEYSNFVALCRKEYDGIEKYDQCDLAKIMVSYSETEI